MQEYENFDVTELLLGVRAGSNEAFSELSRRYFPMIKKVVSGFLGGGIRSDEALCEASVAFYKAAMTYDESRTDVTFGLYARICVYRRLCDLAGKVKGKEDFFTDLNVENLSVQSPIEANLVSRESMAKALQKIKSLLSEYEYGVFILHLEGYTSAAIAERLGKTSKSVDNAKARAIKRLRESRIGFSEL